MLGPPLSPLLGLAAMLLAGPLLAPTAPVFVVEDADAERVLLCRPLGAGQAPRLALVYTHSMYGGDVVEEFVPTVDRRLRREVATTANAAAAEYYASDGGVRRDGDRFLIEAPLADYPELVVRVGRTGGHRLVVGDETVDLVALAGDRRPVRLVLRSVGPVARLTDDTCQRTNR